MEYGTSRGFPAEFVLLGLLVDGPAHGYDLQQRLESGLGAVWRIAVSQLYNVLHRLEDRAWIATSDEQGPGPLRHVVSLTETGERAFWTWAVEPVARLRDVRVELLAKMYFLRRHRPSELSGLIERQRKTLDAALRTLDGNRAGAMDDPWIASVAESFRRRQMASALEWLADAGESLRKTKETK
jgi:DNA-binding PadR family transcriptional regulator